MSKHGHSTSTWQRVLVVLACLALWSMLLAAPAWARRSYYWGACVQPVACGPASCEFAVNWNNGTDAKNTGADNIFDCCGDNTWSSQASGVTRITSGTLEGAGSLSTGATTVSRYVQAFLGVYPATRAIREKFKLVTNGLTTSGDYMDVCALKGGGDTVQAYARIENSSGTLQVQGYVRVADDSFQPIGSAITISPATTYQVELKRVSNTANAAWLKLWQEDGTAQVGTTQQLSGYTTRNATHGYISAGAVAIQSTGNSTLYIDQFQSDNTDFVGPVTE